MGEIMPKPGEVYQCGSCLAVVLVLRPGLDPRARIVRFRYLNKVTARGVGCRGNHNLSSLTVRLTTSEFRRKFSRWLPEPEAAGYLIMED